MIKKIIFLLLISCWLFAMLNACNKNVELQFIKVEPQNISKEVQNFVARNSEKNGVYLYLKENDEKYLFLNAFNIKQGEKAVSFKDIKYTIKKDTLNIYFNEELTNDYSKRLDNRLIYKIKLSMKIDTIKVFKKGREISIDVVALNS